MQWFFVVWVIFVVVGFFLLVLGLFVFFSLMQWVKYLRGGESANGISTSLWIQDRVCERIKRFQYFI